MQTVLSLGPDDTQGIGVFFEVHSAANTKLTEAQFEPYIFENSDYDYADLQLFTCGAHPASGLETDPSRWSLIGRGRQSRGQSRLPLRQHISIQAGETHGFCIHTSQRKALVTLVTASAENYMTDGAITIRGGLVPASRTPFTDVSPDRFYVPKGRFVFDTEVKLLQLSARQNLEGHLSIACHNMAGEMLKEFSMVDPDDAFSALAEQIQCHLPGARWQIVLPSGECPDGSKLDAALGDLFEVASLRDERDEVVSGSPSQGDHARVESDGSPEQ